MKKFGMILLVFAVIAIAITTMVCIYRYHQRQLYTPKINPNPKHFITVEGYISPKLGKNMSIRWTVGYSVARIGKPCWIIDNWLEGAGYARWKRESYYPLIKNNHYSMKISVNKYRPGYCKWRPYYLAYDLLFNGKPFDDNGSFVHLSKKPVKSVGFAKDVFVCKEINNTAMKCDYDLSKRREFNSNWKVYVKKKGLKFIIDILAHKKEELPND